MSILNCPDIENRLRRFPQPDIGTHNSLFQCPEALFEIGDFFSPDYFRPTDDGKVEWEYIMELAFSAGSLDAAFILGNYKHSADAYDKYWLATLEHMTDEELLNHRNPNGVAVIMRELMNEKYDSYHHPYHEQCVRFGTLYTIMQLSDQYIDYSHLTKMYIHDL